MNPQERAVPVDEIVGLLFKYDREKLDKLKNSFPKYEHLLKVGVHAGENDLEEELRFRSQVCAEGLKTIIGICRKKIPRIKQRLKLNSKVLLVSLILAATCSIITVILLNAHINKTLPSITALFSLISSISGLIAYKPISTFRFGSRSLAAVFENLVKKETDAEYLLQEIGIAVRFSQDYHEEIKELIRRGNKLSLETKALFKYL